MEELDETDMLQIALSQFGTLGAPLLTSLISFVRALQRTLTVRVIHVFMHVCLCVCDRGKRCDVCAIYPTSNPAATTLWVLPTHTYQIATPQPAQARLFGASGGPWDFNLRDIFRWCELMQAEQRPPHWRPAEFLDTLFLQVSAPIL